MNNNDLDLLKSSIREYINIIIATTMPYVEKHNLNKDFSGNDLLSVNLKVLQNIDYMLVNTIHDKKLALELKDEVVKVEKNINNSLLICIFSTTDRLFNPLTSKITVHIIYLYIDSHI